MSYNYNWLNQHEKKASIEKQHNKGEKQQKTSIKTT